MFKTKRKQKQFVHEKTSTENLASHFSSEDCKPQTLLEFIWSKEFFENGDNFFLLTKLNFSLIPEANFSLN